MQLRLADRQDADAIATVINSAFKKAEAFFIDDDRIDVESVRSLMEKGKFLIAGDHDAVTGCVYVELRGERAYLHPTRIRGKRNGTVSSRIHSEAAVPPRHMTKPLT